MARKPTTIDEYLSTVSAEKRRTLENLRKAIRKIVPKTEECISYGIPAFRVNGRLLVGFGAWANHCSFYPMSSTTLRKFQRDVKNFQTSKGTLRFAPDEPLPASFVKKLVQARIAEICS